jgi:hypothetical protein
MRTMCWIGEFDPELKFTPLLRKDGMDAVEEPAPLQAARVTTASPAVAKTNRFTPSTSVSTYYIPRCKLRLARVTR